MGANGGGLQTDSFCATNECRRNEDRAQDSAKAAFSWFLGDGPRSSVAAFPIFYLGAFGRRAAIGRRRAVCVVAAVRE